ncbi:MULTISPECIES: sigma-70 family RNA polymerase sigma factor [unclassified Nostoc]|uniref:sigma-70 family RNA polymerase sigma factor n=1 Tax=unclassified Nostoc TaxID=2593658 RepID=UPI002AD40743|nr:MULTISPECIES: sigma-70 family RNA polymerase sigma factor [unclassified Nostoc]MDZ8121801.1 sigma-70 family RNA polymerase sigma factor [Nostoc sp. CmiVER01]MDZ8223583.1 sigma-70 family RNA polymerase sigma factor [Nostoc sp. ChiVER01]
MQIPHFPEANHPLVKSLFHHSDHELLTLFQQNPDAGKYFTVIFCRYSPIVYTLIRHSARSPVQADYLFALTWRHIYYELGGLNLTDSESGKEALTMQNWLINMTAFCINEIKVPPTEAIHYSLQATSPPLWCYVQQALDQLPPVLRLIVLMVQTFHWSETRIAAYLQAEGEAIAPSEVADFLQEGYRMLEDKLPTDIRAIYFGEDLAQS